MKTKIVVGGGYDTRTDECSEDFFKELLKGLNGEIAVLIVVFAQPEEKHTEKFEKVVKQFQRNGPGKNLKFKLAIHQTFEADLASSDVVYFYSGDTLKLVEEVGSHRDFLNLIKGKVIAGESAGTYLLSTKFYSKTIGGVCDGLGVLPIKTICHFDDRNEEKLDEISPGLEKVLLRNYDYRVYDI